MWGDSMDINELKRKHEEFDGKIAANNKQISKLTSTMRELQNMINTLRQSNEYLYNQRNEVGFQICQTEGHDSDWENSYLSDGEAVCECKRCKRQAKIKL